MKLIVLFLTCANQAEADTIADALLKKKLVACVKIVPVSAKFLWQGAIDTAHEILLVMDSESSKFAVIEQEVRKHHSYKTFVLTAIEIANASDGVEKWIQESMR